MTRKPTTLPERNYSSIGQPPVRSLPTFRPSMPGEPDLATSWMPFKQALEVAADVVGAASAEQWLMRRVMLGVLPISCEMLFYGRDDGDRAIEKRRWPGADVRLAEQLMQANERLPRSRLRRDGTDFQWFDVTGPYPVNVLMMGAHVDGHALAASLSRSVEAKPASDPIAPPTISPKKGKVGRRAGSGNYPSDELVIPKIIEAARSMPPETKGRLSHAIRLYIGEVEGPSDDEAKKKRIKRRVGGICPDLRD